MMYWFMMTALAVVVCRQGALALKQCGAAAGDPHINANNVPGWVTCSAPGIQLYLANPYVTMTATHVGIPGAFTLIKRIKIVLMDPTVGPIDKYLVPNSLAGFPTKFTSGATATTLGPFVATVNAMGPMGPVTVTLTFNGQTVVVIVLNGKKGSTIRSVNACVFSVKGLPPFTSTGMLITGCPAGQIIGVGTPGRRRRRAPKTSDCEQFEKFDYVANCMFDSDNVGEQFAIEAGKAMVDSEQVMAKYQRGRQ